MDKNFIEIQRQDESLLVILLKGGDKKNSRYLDASRFLSFFLFPCNLLKRAVYVNDYDRGIVSITLKKERGGIEHECARASAYPRQNAESVHPDASWPIRVHRTASWELCYSGEALLRRIDNSVIHAITCSPFAYRGRERKYIYIVALIR